jgi:uncharacterized protein
LKLQDSQDKKREGLSYSGNPVWYGFIVRFMGFSEDCYCYMRRVFLLVFLLCSAVLPVNGVSLEDGVQVPLVADYMSDGVEKGVFLNAVVAVEPGSGHVFVDTSPYTQVDLQGSARIAAMVASDITGIDQAAYDFYYVINVPSPVIGGPSAGAALTVATVAAINNWSIKEGVVMTGAISPDNSIGPVGGIPFKLEAAAEKGATLFLIPEGQRMVTVTNRTKKVGPGFIFTESKTEVVDLVEKGEALGVKVQEVADVYDAIYLLTGRQVEVGDVGGEVISGDYVEALEPLAASLREESWGMYADTEELVGSGEMLGDGKKLLQQADEMYDEGNYYAATSLYFNGMVVLRNLQWREEYEQAANKTVALREIRERVYRQINASEMDIERYKAGGVRDVDTIGAAESRVTRARQLVEHADDSDALAYIWSLAFANERARTAQWWLTLTSSEVVVLEEELRNRAAWYLAQAQSVTTYAQTLISESTNFHSSLPGTAEEDLVNAKAEFERGYYSGAIFDSIHAIVKASTIIGLLSGGDVEERVLKSEKEAKNAILEARHNGVEPTLAISAYEYGKTLAEASGKITQYNYAKSVAKTSMVLNSKGVKALNTTNPEITRVIHEKIEPSSGKSVKQSVQQPLVSRKVPGFRGVVLGVVFALLFFVFKRRGRLWVV